MRGDKFVVLVIACAFVPIFLALLDVTRPSDSNGSRAIYPWALRWLPYFGSDYVPVDVRVVNGISWVFGLSFLGLVASAFWFAWVWFRQKIVNRGLSRQQVKGVR